MSRPLRLEYPGALFCVRARGCPKETIFRDDHDREFFLDLLGKCVKRFSWILSAYALAPDRFYLVIELTCETLSKGMKWLNGSYAQAFNRRHQRVGYLFHRRFRAPLIEKESYFRRVLRDVVLKSVAAGLATRPEEYAWTSHRAVIGAIPAPDWLALNNVLTQFAPRPDRARAAYQHFVEAEIGVRSVLWTNLVGDMFLGTDEWIQRVRERINLKLLDAEHPRAQRLVGLPTMSAVIAAVAETFSIDEARIRHGRGGIPRLFAAWIGCREAQLTNTQMASELRLRNVGWVTSIVGQCDRELDRNPWLRDGLDRCLATLRRKNC